MAAAGVVCTSVPGKPCTFIPFSAPLSQCSSLSPLHKLECSESWCTVTGPDPKAKWNNQGNITSFWMEYRSKISHSWVISNSKASCDFKGPWILNFMDSHGSHFPTEDLDGGDGLPPLRWVFGVWQLFDPCLLSLDHQGLCIEWQMQAKQQWLGYASACVIWLCLQAAQLQPVSSYDTWKWQFLFQVSTGCFMA